MRIGYNPLKDTKIDHSYYHRVIIPIFIPNLQEKYFINGLEVTKLCLESLIKTIHSKTCITVINNGSCKEVTEYLQDLFVQQKVHQLIHHKNNIGKIDAIIPIAKTSEESLITITDGDVLFKTGWIQAVESIFVNFPEAGMVSPVPHGTTYYNHTINTLFDGFFKGLLKFQSLCNPDDMLLFAESIGKKDSMYKKSIRLKTQLTVKRKDQSAVIGCGHFVSTLRKEVFTNSPNDWSRWAYASEADKNYIDIPNEKAKLWRLATIDNLAYHIGNTPTAWMKELFETIGQNPDLTHQIPPSKKWNVPFTLKKFTVRLLFSKTLRPFVFGYLGLKEGKNDF